MTRALFLLHGFLSLAYCSQLSSPQQLRLATETEEVPQVIDEYLERLLQQYHFPGLAIAVTNGKQKWSKGYGYAELPSKPMSPKTLFYCGSTTKSFTAAAMSLLVDDNKAFPDVQWDTPLSSLIRDDFVLSDSWSTEHITIEDALSHRTGYAGHTMGINNSDSRECTRRLRHLPMSAEPRTIWQYSNYMFTAVGHAIEVLTGRWLGDIFRKELWEPMGMHNTFLKREHAESSGLPFAAEYWWDEVANDYVLVPHLPDGRGREGAGMVISNVEDYSKYLETMLHERSPISKAGHTALKTPKMLLPTASPFEDGQFYGLGWAGGTPKGIRYWFHNGRIREHVVDMRIVPEKQFSVIVMVNANEPDVLFAVSRTISAFYIEEQWRPEWPAIDRTRITSQTCQSSVYPNKPIRQTPPAADLISYTGSYHNAGYGNLKLVMRQSGSNPDKIHYLWTQPMMGFDGLTFEVMLEHYNGEHWLGKVYILEHNSHKTDEKQHLELCIRGETAVDSAGRVSRIGLDFRQEKSDGPLIWFERTD